MSIERSSSDVEKYSKEDAKPNVHVDTVSSMEGTGIEGMYVSTSAEHRKLESYHINLISIGGTIGTALFVYMGSGLTHGGPANLLLGYAWWTSVIWAVAEGQVEMVTMWPTDSGFTRYASRYVDTAAGFALGYNFFISQVALVIFEVVAFGVVAGYWEGATQVPAWAFITLVIGAYAILNLWDTRFFGGAEFTAAIGKVLLIVGLIAMTFITMLGGNPTHDRFGFRYWQHPGAFKGPYPAHGASTNKFEGFLACVINACFTVAGPEYLTMVAGEARNPRKVMKAAFKKTVYRLVIFFIGSALCIGILVPYNDPNLLGAQAAGAPGAAKSPYVIAMNRMQIKVLPSLVNALILSSVFSAGNAFLFCASRSLAQMSRDGMAPKIFARRNRNGVPWVSVTLCLLITLLSYCQVSTSASVVITYLTGLVGAAQLVNWVVFSFTHIRWRKAMEAQGISRDTLYARSMFQPYAAWYAMLCSIFVFFLQGYSIFLKDSWDVPTFFFSYWMGFQFIILYVGWKFIKKTKFETVLSADVTSWVNSPEFDPMEYVEPARGPVSSIVNKVLKFLF